MDYDPDLVLTEMDDHQAYYSPDYGSSPVRGGYGKLGSAPGGQDPRSLQLPPIEYLSTRNGLRNLDSPHDSPTRMNYRPSAYVTSQPKPAWPSSTLMRKPAPEPGALVAPSRKAHVQAIAKNRMPEVMAEDIMSLKEQVHRLMEESKIVTVQKRRLELELSKTRGNLQKAEELLNRREKILSPNMGMSQLYKTPDKTSLVANLKEQCRQLRGARDQLATELSSLQKTTRATRVAELEAEVQMYAEELGRQARINSVLHERLGLAEGQAQQAGQRAEAAIKALNEYMGDAAVDMLAGGNKKPLPGGPSSAGISAGKVRKTLQALQQAHRLITGQAQFLRTYFPPGLSMDQFQETAALRSSTAGATEVLRFLRTHVTRLESELLGMPGAPDKPPVPPSRSRPTSARNAAEKAKQGGLRRYNSFDGAEGSADAAPAPDLSDPTQLRYALGEKVEQLANLQPDEFKVNAPLKEDMQKLNGVADMFCYQYKRLSGLEVEVKQTPLVDNPVYTPTNVPPSGMSGAFDEDAAEQELKDAADRGLAAAEEVIAVQEAEEAAKEEEEETYEPEQQLEDDVAAGQEEAVPPEGEAEVVLGDVDAPPPEAEPEPAPEAQATEVHDDVIALSAYDEDYARSALDDASVMPGTPTPASVAPEGLGAEDQPAEYVDENVDGLALGGETQAEDYTGDAPLEDGLGDVPQQVILENMAEAPAGDEAGEGYEQAGLLEPEPEAELAPADGETPVADDVVAADEEVAVPDSQGGYEAYDNTAAYDELAPPEDALVSPGAGDEGEGAGQEEGGSGGDEPAAEEGDLAPPEDEVQVEEAPVEAQEEEVVEQQEEELPAETPHGTELMHSTYDKGFVPSEVPNSLNEVQNALAEEAGVAAEPAAAAEDDAELAAGGEPEVAAEEVPADEGVGNDLIQDVDISNMDAYKDESYLATQSLLPPEPATPAPQTIMEEAEVEEGGEEQQEEQEREQEGGDEGGEYGQMDDEAAVTQAGGDEGEGEGSAPADSPEAEGGSGSGEGQQYEDGDEGAVAPSGGDEYAVAGSSQVASQEPQQQQEEEVDEGQQEEVEGDEQQEEGEVEDVTGSQVAGSAPVGYEEEGSGAPVESQEDQGDEASLAGPRSAAGGASAYQSQAPVASRTPSQVSRAVEGGEGDEVSATVGEGETEGEYVTESGGGADESGTAAEQEDDNGELEENQGASGEGDGDDTVVDSQAVGDEEEGAATASLAEGNDEPESNPQDESADAGDNQSHVVDGDADMAVESLADEEGGDDVVTPAAGSRPSY